MPQLQVAICLVYVSSDTSLHYPNVHDFNQELDDCLIQNVEDRKI